LSSGLPAVVADATGSNALVSDGLTGYLAPPRLSSAFLERVETLVKDRGLREKMGSAARESAKAYEWDAILGQIASCYEEVA
jgi:phosphatidylinositol alpha 1,6-mannosyltransferase